MTGRPREPSAIGLPQLGIMIMLGAMFVWGWTGSASGPEGCYRIDANTSLSVADGRIRLAGKHGADALVVRTIKSKPARGWIITLDHPLSYDPAKPSEAQLVQRDPGATPRTMFIEDHFGEASGIHVETEKGTFVRFPEMDCDTSQTR